MENTAIKTESVHVEYFRTEDAKTLYKASYTVGGAVEVESYSSGDTETRNETYIQKYWEEFKQSLVLSNVNQYEKLKAVYIDGTN